jgi:SHS2 domain-containing protein
MDFGDRAPAIGREPGKGPDWLDRVEHTADEGLLVKAADRKELFARAAWGMFSLLTDMSAVRPLETVAVNVEAPDIEALMVRWLSDLNYLHLVGRKLFCGFEVARLTRRTLEARARGEAIDPRRHAIRREIKAVTFHGLKVAREGSVWTARVIFDV